MLWRAAFACDGERRLVRKGGLHRVGVAESYLSFLSFSKLLGMLLAWLGTRSWEEEFFAV